MPENRSILLCASGVIVAGLAAPLLAPRCAFEQAAAETTVGNPIWGTVRNLAVMPTKDGDLFEATSANGYHRILRAAQVTEPGRYRVSIETAFDRTPDLAIEIGGTNQPYAFAVANLRTGKIETTKGSALDAGSEPLGPGRFRWWVEQEYVPGEVDYDFGILGVGGATSFPGQANCRMILSNPGFRLVKK
jgi:hypothetical protein